MNDDAFEIRKRVDEDWKERVEKEKTSLESRPRPTQSSGRTRERETPQADFGLFLSTLSMQAMMALGELPHPETHQPQEDLEQARYLIDILGMLQEKTKGNLTPEEAKTLEGVLYELRVKFVAKSKK